MCSLEGQREAETKTGRKKVIRKRAKRNSRLRVNEIKMTKAHSHRVGNILTCRVSKTHNACRAALELDSLRNKGYRFPKIAVYLCNDPSPRGRSREGKRASAKHNVWF